MPKWTSYRKIPPTDTSMLDNMKWQSEFYLPYTGRCFDLIRIAWVLNNKIILIVFSTMHRVDYRILLCFVIAGNSLSSLSSLCHSPSRVLAGKFKRCKIKNMNLINRKLFAQTTDFWSEDVYFASMASPACARRFLYM